MSKKPPFANPEWDDDYEESDKVCEKCKDKRMWISGWYDDSPEMGGACVGTMYECGDCGETDYY